MLKTQKIKKRNQDVNSYILITIIVLSKLFYQIYVYSKTIFLMEINDTDTILSCIYRIIDNSIDNRIDYSTVLYDSGLFYN